jgi:hypothetical protein
MKRQKDLEPARPAKSLREQLQEAVNANTVRAAAAGFAEIDKHAGKAKKKLESWGITGLDELVDSAATAIKRKSIELATGRPQK